jgi:hypothetical protein
MRIALISPIAGLEKWSALSHIHLVLAQVEDERYINFYKRMRERGDLLILDNGAYENQLVAVDRLREMREEYHPQIIVLPDNPHLSSRNNFELAQRAWKDLNLHQGEFMFVPQGPCDVWSWLHYIERAVNEMRVTWIGLPRESWNAVSHAGEYPERVRATLAFLIRSRLSNRVKIHALGQFGSNPLAEKYLLEEAGIYSMDTSGPVWRGWQGFEITNADWLDIALDLNANSVGLYGNEELIKQNLINYGFLSKSGKPRKEAT